MYLPCCGHRVLPSFHEKLYAVFYDRQVAHFYGIVVRLTGAPDGGVVNGYPLTILNLLIRHPKQGGPGSFS